MHAYGGLYLDIDVECFYPTDELLASRDVVLQLEDKTPKSLNNAVMASVPGHPFWLKMVQIMQDRGNSANDCFLGFRDLGTVLKTTGVLQNSCTTMSIRAQASQRSLHHTHRQAIHMTHRMGCDDPDALPPPYQAPVEIAIASCVTYM